MADEHREHLGVGVADEFISLSGEGLLKYGIVFDGAVMHHGHPAVVAEMGMGVGVARFAVGSPACVGYAEGAGDILALAVVLEVAYLAFGLVDVETVVATDQRDASGVVSAVFEAVEAADEDRICITESYVSYYSAHDDVCDLFL